MTRKRDPQKPRTVTLMLTLFSITIFLGAALLFLVQPMAAKLILPRLGGTPGVWNGCMVLFQAALLGGYGYAHVLGVMKPGRRPLLIHTVALGLAALTLPVGLRQITQGFEDSSPMLAVVTMLAVGFGAPFLMMSTGGSLMQRWFSTTDHPQAHDPYFLYGASNAGSLIGLLGYPLLVEPNLTLGQQRWGWSAGYALWAGLTIACVFVASKRPALITAPTTLRSNEALVPAMSVAPESLRRRWARYAIWIALAAVPSSLVLGATQYITMDLAAIPLLWVVPLAAYLLTFIVAFSPRMKWLVSFASWAFIPLLALIVWAWFENLKYPIVGIVAMHVAAVFLGGTACHGKLASLRPGVENLTRFYLCIAVGGVLGGSFNALVAPWTLVRMEEYPIALILALILGFPSPASWSERRMRATRLIVSASAAVALLMANAGTYQAPGSTNILHSRSFFGVLRVRQQDDGAWRRLLHGNTLHGIQASSNPEWAKLPTSYYHPTGPVGDVFRLTWPGEMPSRAAFVGLGAGTLAAYGKEPSQRFTFYEIDPDVVRIAFDPEFFTFISDSKATVDSVVGDARLSLVKEPDGAFDLIMLDAFSSDAIPVHLITLEAGQLYRSKLKPRGLLAIHITNRYLDLRGVIASLALDLELVAMSRYDTSKEFTELETNTGRLSSSWVVLGTDGPWAAALAGKKWERIDNRTTEHAWTDDFSDVLTVFRRSGTR